MCVCLSVRLCVCLLAFVYKCVYKCVCLSSFLSVCVLIFVVCVCARASGVSVYVFLSGMCVFVCLSVLMSVLLECECVCYFVC